jgi:WD40 repeat protein
MHHLFISYSRKDRPFVEPLAKALADQGRTAWVDWKDIPPTATFMEEIRRAIEGADSFVFVLSPDSVVSPVCRQEVEHAVLHHKRLIPVVCRGVEANECLPALAAINWIFFDGAATFDASVQRLTTAIDTDLAWVREHTELLTRAIDWEQGGRRRSPLLRGEDLTAAEHEMVQAADGRQPQPTSLQREFVLASRRDASRRLRTVIGAVSLALVATLVLAVVAFVQFRLADRRARIADSRRLATVAKTLVADQLDLSMLLSIEAFRTAPTLEAKSALLGSLQQSPYLKRFLRGHTGEVLSVAYHPNGRLLVSGGEKEMIVWDLATGRPARPPLPQQYVEDLQFSPDGKTLGGKTWQHEEHLPFFWDTRTWKPIGPQVEGDFKGFAPDGRALILKGLELRKLDVRAQTWSGPLVELPDDFLASLFSLQFAFSSDGSWLAGEHWYAGVNLWNLATGERRDPPADVPHLGVTALLFDPKGRFVLSVDHDEGISFWDVKTLQPFGDPIGAHSGITHLAVSPDGTVIASGDDDHRIKLWRGDIRQQIGGALSAHRGEIRGLAFSPDGRSLASAGEDGAVLLWDVITPQPPRTPLGGHQILGGIDHFGPSAVPSEEKAEEEGIYAFAEARGQSARTLLRFSPDATVLAAGSGGGSVDLWIVARGTKRIGSLRLFPESLRSLALSPDGTVLAAGGTTGDPIDPQPGDREVVALVAVPSGKHLARPLHGKSGFGQTVTFSPDGRTLVVGGKDGLMFLDVRTGRILARLVRSGFSEISALAYRPDGSGLILSGKTAAHDAPVTELWDPGERKRVRALQKEQFSALVFSPDGKLVATGEKGGFVVRDGVSFEPRTLPSSEGLKDKDMSFSPDGQSLAIVGDSGVQLWNVGDRQAIGSPLQIPSTAWGAEPVDAVAFTRDGKTLLSAYPLSKTLVHWDLDPESWMRRICKIVQRNLTAIEWKQYLGNDVPYQKTCDLRPR